MAEPIITYTTADGKEKRNFFDAKHDDNFWEGYMAARPVYSRDFYDLIFDYHKKIGAGGLTLAHDVGTGPGNVANELVARGFEQVIASDASPEHAAAAQFFLRGRHDVSKFMAVSAAAETLGTTADSGLWLGKTDLITAAECIPIMDMSAAMKTFHSLLSPGGTLAVWFYGRPIFLADDSDTGEVHAETQAAYDRLPTTAFGRVRPQKQTKWQESTNTMVSWLEDLPIDYEASWADVHRYTWNRDRPMCFFGDEACDFVPEATSLADPEKETRRDVKDRTIFAARWTVDNARLFVKANLPAFAQSDALWAELEPMFQDLETAMGGAGASLVVTWPVTLILARKR